MSSGQSQIIAGLFFFFIGFLEFQSKGINCEGVDLQMNAISVVKI